MPTVRRSRTIHRKHATKFEQYIDILKLDKINQRKIGWKKALARAKKGATQTEITIHKQNTKNNKKIRI